MDLRFHASSVKRKDWRSRKLYDQFPTFEKGGRTFYHSFVLLCSPLGQVSSNSSELELACKLKGECNKGKLWFKLLTFSKKMITDILFLPHRYYK